MYDPRADYIAKKRTVGVGVLSGAFEEALTPGAAPTTFTQGTETEATVNYKIVDGVSYAEYVSNLNSKLTRELINEAEVNNNQNKQEEVTNSGPESQEQINGGATSGSTSGSTGMDDMEVIGCFGFYDYLDFEVEEINKEDGSAFSKENLSLTFRLEFHAKVGIDEIALNKAQSAKFYLKNTDTKQKELLATFRLSPNDSKSIDFEVDDGTQGKKSQLLSFTGSNNKSRIIFQVDVDVDDNQAKVSFIREAYRKSGSSLQVEWDNTSGKAMFYGWSKTIGKPNFF